MFKRLSYIMLLSAAFITTISHEVQAAAVSQTGDLKELLKNHDIASIVSEIAGKNGYDLATALKNLHDSVTNCEGDEEYMLDVKASSLQITIQQFRQAQALILALMSTPAPVAPTASGAGAGTGPTINLKSLHAERADRAKRKREDEAEAAQKRERKEAEEKKATVDTDAKRASVAPRVSASPSASAPAAASSSSPTPVTPAKKAEIKNVSCSICITDVPDSDEHRIHLECTHDFCVDCLVPWYTKREEINIVIHPEAGPSLVYVPTHYNTCPNCRAEFKQPDHAKLSVYLAPNWKDVLRTEMVASLTEKLALLSPTQRRTLLATYDAGFTRMDLTKLQDTGWIANKLFIDSKKHSATFKEEVKAPVAAPRAPAPTPATRAPAKRLTPPPAPPMPAPSAPSFLGALGSGLSSAVSSLLATPSTPAAASSPEALLEKIRIQLGLPAGQASRATAQQTFIDTLPLLGVVDQESIATGLGLSISEYVTLHSTYQQ